MGMYDNIKAPPMDCPTCGEPLCGWQSKDGPCEMDTLDYWRVDNFYTDCGKCKTWVEFTLPKESRTPIPLAAYVKEVSAPEGPSSD